MTPPPLPSLPLWPMSWGSCLTLPQPSHFLLAMTTSCGLLEHYVVSCALKGFALFTPLEVLLPGSKSVSCARRQNKGGHHSLGGGAIAGIVIGVLLALAAVGAVVGVLVMRRRRQVAGGGAPGSMKAQKSTGGEHHARGMPLRHLYSSAIPESPDIQ